MIVASAPGSWHGAQRGQGGSAPWPWSGPGGTVSCGRARGACPSIRGRPLGPLSGESAARCHGADAPRPQTVGRHVASAFVFAEGDLAALTSAALSTRFLLRKCRVAGRIERNAVRKAFSFRLWRAAWRPVAPTLAQARRSGSSAVPHCGPGLSPGAPDRLLVHVTRVTRLPVTGGLACTSHPHFRE